MKKLNKTDTISSYEQAWKKSYCLLLKSKRKGYFQISFSSYLSIAAPLVRNFCTKSWRSWHKETGLQRLSQTLGKQNTTGVTHKRHFAWLGCSSYTNHSIVRNREMIKENICFAQCQYSNQYCLPLLILAFLLILK